MFRVATYNLLSSHLAESTYFSHCKPQALKNRWQRLSEQLTGEIDKGAVLCLQEVSQTWAANLAVLLSSRGYHSISALYGGKKSGHMGVAIAFDTAKFVLEDCSIRTLGETREFVTGAKSESSKLSPSSSTGWFGWLQSMIFGGEVANAASIVDPFERANARENMIIAVKLRQRSTDAIFCVVTYHMPCEFNFPKLMVIHTVRRRLSVV
jgi:2',5'-phosphodiesterase